MTTYLVCGDVAMAVHAQAHDGLPEQHPSCPVHMVCEAAEAPSLEGRTAVCSYPHRGTPVPSQWTLAFFTYRGPGSRGATEQCLNCGYYKVAHERQEGLVDPRSVIDQGKCSGFVPHGPWDYDEYYDGCYGWD